MRKEAVLNCGRPSKKKNVYVLCVAESFGCCTMLKAFQHVSAPKIFCNKC
jgi:hypothetical protein